MILLPSRSTLFPYTTLFRSNNGEVCFITESGLISYRSDASQGDLEYTNVIVFPNPVKPDYHGPITIQGIAYDSDVKITDVSGKLVYRTHSNGGTARSEEHTSELQSRPHLVCRLLLEKKKNK